MFPAMELNETDPRTSIVIRHFAFIGVPFLSLICFVSC